MRTIYARFRTIVLPALFGLLSACGSDEGLDGLAFEAPETAVSYDVTVAGLPNDQMTALAEESLATFRRREDGAQSAAFLRRRAEGDIDTIRKILRSRGYYKGTVEVAVVPPPDDKPDDPAVVTFTVDPGPVFTLARHDLALQDPSGTAPALSAAELGSPVGGPAAAAEIVDAETAAVDRLQRRGFPYAERGKRRAVADLEGATLEIDTPIATGPAALFGPVLFEGLADVRARYLRTYIPWTDGDIFDLEDLRTYQQALLGTDLFDTVLVTPPPEPPSNPGPAPLPVTVTAEERPFQTVSAGARFSTDDGPSVTAGYEHRNLFGENETITVEAEIGIPLQRFGVGYREPQYMRPGQDLLASFVVTREEDDAFDALTATLTAGLQRRISRRWVLGFGGLAEVSQITDEGEDTLAYLFGIPLLARYDRTDDPLNPTKGERLLIELTPYAGIFDDEFTPFFTLDTTGSAYYDITGSQDYILAGRARFGSILAEDVDKVPPTRRLYSGGGGSVRGYAQRFIGPLDANNDPEGGLSAVELGIEMRARLFGDFGGVIFAEAGSVGQESFPDFEEDIQTAAGLGFRYYSPAGPIRVDVALPLNPRDADDAFQFYFSIGQAF